MPAIATGRFTVGVFQDVAWAERGLDALKREGFPLESLTIIAKEGAETAALVEKALGSSPRIELRRIGPVIGLGPLIEALQGNDGGLMKVGLGLSMRRVGFQAHDGHIFEALLDRGGVLVSVRSEPRAADALAVLHAYGGGNAAIGAWTGRV